MKSTALSKCIGDVFFSNNEEYKVLTVSASIDLRRSIKKLGFYGEILLNKMLSN